MNTDQPEISPAYCHCIMLVPARHLTVQHRTREVGLDWGRNNTLPSAKTGPVSVLLDAVVEGLGHRINLEWAFKEITHTNIRLKPLYSSVVDP